MESRTVNGRTKQQKVDMTKTRNGLENGLTSGLERTCLKSSLAIEIHCIVNIQPEANL